MTVQKTETPGMFSSIAGSYDLLNRVLSFSIDGRWRKQLVKTAGVTHGSRVLDVATGTADVAIAFARAFDGGRIVGLDPSPGMLDVARRKLEKQRLKNRIELVEGDALALPFDSGSFDVVTIAFGLRNLPDFAGGVKEMARVLGPGGRLLILEFFPPRNKGLFAVAYRVYLKTILPVAGRLISRSDQAYDYLSSSIRDFASRDDCLGFMEHVGLTGLQLADLTGGVSSICSGRKPR